MIPRSNFYVLSTCSSHNVDLVKSFDADFVVDYNAATAVSELQPQVTANELTIRSLTLYLDAISSESTARFCSKVLDPPLERRQRLEVEAALQRHSFVCSFYG